MTTPTQSAKLIAHWPLSGDTNDHGPARHATRAVDVGFDSGGPFPGSKAGLFNGKTSCLEVADNAALRLGAKDFTLAAWVRSDPTQGDVAGDLVSKFDAKARRGFQLLILSSTGVTSASQANRRHLQFGIDAARIDPAWTDHGRPGAAHKICALAASGGRLYAGTFEGESSGSGKLWRFEGGQTWTDLGNPLRCNSVQGVAEFNGDLYAATARYKAMGSALGGTHNATPGGRVFRVTAGGEWVDCGVPGGVGAVPSEKAVEGYDTGQADAATALTVFKGQLFATSLYRRGAWRYAGGTEWVDAGLQDRRLMTFAVYRGDLYALINGGPVYRYEGGTSWAFCGNPAGSTQTYCAVTHAGGLFVGTWPKGEVFRYEGGESWRNFGRMGYEMEVMGGSQYNGKAYWGGLPMANVYRMEEEGGHTMVGNLDAAPVPLRRVWSMATYDGRLFAGTLPGGRVWSIQAGRMASWDQTFPGGWRHVAAVRQGDTLRLFVDGRPVAWSSRFTPETFDLDTAAPLRIGAGAYEHFDGAMSDVRLYDGAMSEPEIAALLSPRAGA